MKIKAKVCPNKCKSPKSRKYVRMKIVPSLISRGKDGGIADRTDYRVAWILNYVCPSCGASEPVNSKDIFRGSKRPRYMGTQPVREGFTQ